MFQKLLWSFAFRPYVTVFLFAFLAISRIEQGWTRTLFWLVSSYLVAFAAEWASINHGIPFGWYAYRYEALENDLVIFGVPFFDSLSFSFLSYVSFSFAQFFVAPIPNSRSQREGLRRDRNSTFVLLLGAAFMVVVDLIVDPLALLGGHWFLGEIYRYLEPGIHFGVPWENYAGWLVVALLTIFVNQRFDESMRGRTPNDGLATRLSEFKPRLPYGPMLWVTIVLFQLGVTYWLALSGDPAVVDRKRVMLQALTGSAIIAPILALAAFRLAAHSRRAV